VIAIGGIDASSVGDCIAAGADGVAVITAIAIADDMVKATARMRKALDKARSRRGRKAEVQ